MSVKNSNETIGDRTRDLPACSAMPQPTAPPRASITVIKVRNFQRDFLYICKKIHFHRNYLHRYNAPNSAITFTTAIIFRWNTNALAARRLYKRQQARIRIYYRQAESSMKTQRREIARIKLHVSDLTYQGILFHFLRHGPHVCCLTSVLLVCDIVRWHDVNHWTQFHHRCWQERPQVLYHSLGPQALLNVHWQNHAFPRLGFS